MTYRAIRQSPPKRGTGIYVSASNNRGPYSLYDIACLDKESLKLWLRSKGGENLWAENTVLVLLGHEVDEREFDPLAK